jgi:hypothetical protein
MQKPGVRRREIGEGANLLPDFSENAEVRRARVFSQNLHELPRAPGS